MSEDIEMRNEMNKITSLVFIHGAWHTADVWKKLVTSLFINDEKYRFIAIQLPMEGSSSFDDYKKRVHETLDKFENITLIGHSSAGLLIQEICNHPNIEKLIFINAFVLPVGLSQFDVIPKGIADEMTFIASQFNNCVPVNEDFVRNMLMNNEKEDDIQELLQNLLPQPISLFTTKITKNISQINKLKYYIYCKDDVSMPPGAYKSMANNLGNYEWIECDGGHETLFTNPQKIADILIKII